jgi:hypothetical protein
MNTIDIIKNELSEKKSDIKNNINQIINNNDILIENDKDKQIEYINNFNFNNEKTIIYYSQTKYRILFQRPQQIMRFFDNKYNKIFITKENIVKYESKYNLLIISYELKDILFEIVNNVTIYYTDSRLTDEVIKLGVDNILFDLIDAPIDEFVVWKPDLEKAVSNADYVIYSHPELIKFLTEINKDKEYHYISNGCDYEHFSKAKNKIGERPLEFPQNDKPILGYYGAFSQWLDYDFIKKHADDDKYNIVMIGGLKENPNYNIRFEHKNITWIDHKSYDEIPYYLSWFDVCLLPFKECELTKYVNPCKLWEYMASGKEIINFNKKGNEGINYLEIDATNFEAGVYVLKITGKNTNIIHKISISKS